eukprot:CAMPEP_0182862010 /NCGR_PEP_ID=MMETSP0034_2-20130328/5819_1 /TAXON_ID=156128 /ORGANISM="Nephroselmis pyriformis, Strain CCMP717" /LENGTH=76 /DNA_ID=CAMNT_0024994011 /DNA_START=79 /DNA_END=305 /DNA_ORIENTATION=+
MTMRWSTMRYAATTHTRLEMTPILRPSSSARDFWRGMILVTPPSLVRGAASAAASRPSASMSPALTISPMPRLDSP